MELQDVAALQSSAIVRWEELSVIVLIRNCCVGVCVYFAMRMRERAMNGGMRGCDRRVWMWIMSCVGGNF